MKNKIEFSKDGTSFSFIFANGSESLEINSKEAGFRAITDLAKKDKITVEEFGEFRDQILQAENLPWNESQKINVNIGFIRGLGSLAELVLLTSLSDLLDEPDEPVEIAYLKICDCGHHGRIYCKDLYTGQFSSKEHGMHYLANLKEEGEINSEEFDKVKTEIESSSLPD